jgi:hypothetical protein
MKNDGLFPLTSFPDWKRSSGRRDDQLTSTFVPEALRPSHNWPVIPLPPVRKQRHLGSHCYRLGESCALQAPGLDAGRAFGNSWVSRKKLPRSALRVRGARLGNCDGRRWHPPSAALFHHSLSKNKIAAQPLKTLRRGGDLAVTPD